MNGAILELQGDSFDDLLALLYDRLLSRSEEVEGSRGDLRELRGVTLRLANPLARVSMSEDRGKIFSALGELFWYLSGSDRLDAIETYIPIYRDDAEADGTLYGAYGPRLFEMDAGSGRARIDQIESVCELLRENRSSKRAVIQLFDAKDVGSGAKEVPCTVAFQLLRRNGQLHAVTMMRSNDAYWGLPHDVFCFTMLQEMIARRLGDDLGEYVHFASSMHYYHDKPEAREGMPRYGREGCQRSVPMPPMPRGDPFEFRDTLVDLERRIRTGSKVDLAAMGLPPYWADIVRLLQTFWAKRDVSVTERLHAQMDDAMLKSLVEEKLRKRRTAERQAR